MICLVLGSLMCTTLTAKLTVSGGGYLASLVMSFVCMIGWKILTVSFDFVVHIFPASDLRGLAAGSTDSGRSYRR